MTAELSTKLSAELSAKLAAALSTDLLHQLSEELSTLRPPIKSTTAKTIHACPYCDCTFKSVSGLWYHKRAHHPLKRYQCQSCSFVCGDRSVLRHHVLQQHPKPKKKRKKREEPRSNQFSGQSTNQLSCVMCNGACAGNRCFNDTSYFSIYLAPLPAKKKSK